MYLHNIHLLLVILAVLAGTAPARFIGDGSPSLRPVPNLASCYQWCKRVASQYGRPVPLVKPQPFPFNQIAIQQFRLAGCYRWCNSGRGRRIASQ